MELRGPNGSKLPEEPQAFWWSLKSSGHRGLFSNPVTGIEMTAKRKSQIGRCASISALHHLKDSNEVAVEGSQGLKGQQRKGSWFPATRYGYIRLVVRNTRDRCRRW